MAGFGSTRSLPEMCKRVFGRRGRRLLRMRYFRVNDGKGHMDKDVAKSLISLSKSVDEVIVRMFAEVEKINDEKLRSRFNKAVGDLMGYVARDLIFPIENIYPELKAD
jgi:hypothetical protein